MSANSVSLGAATADSAGSARREWIDGWPVVLAGLFGFMLMSMSTMSMGTFMAPMQNEFGWSRSVFSLGPGMNTLPGFFLPPVTGILIDRLGARPVAVVGSLTVGITFCLFGTATGSLGNWMILWLAHGMASQLIIVTLWSAAVATAFNVSRGIAISVVMSGAALAALVGPILSNILIQTYGFRIAFVIMGAGCGAVVAAVAAWGLRGPRTNSPNVPHFATTAPKDLGTPLGFTFKEGLRTGAFLKLTAVILITYTVILGLTLHLIPLLTTNGLQRGTAIVVAGLYGIAIFAGKILVGVSLDRLPGRVIGGLSILTLFVAIVMLSALGRGVVWYVSAVLLLGLSYGGIAPTYPYLALRHFGLRSFGSLFGVVSCAYSLAAALGPLLAGYTFDITHHYQLFLFGVLPAVAAAMLLCLSLGKYPDFERSAAQA